MKYVKGFDTLRAFAVLLVVFGHWWMPMDITPENERAVHWITTIVPDAGFGVDLFFVLSGFLITSILIDATRNNHEQKLTVIKNFAIRRALRIFPVYYALIIVLIILRFPFENGTLWWYLTYTSNILVYKTQVWNNFSHTWSLSVEEQFYLVWPWLIVFTREKYLKHVLFLSIAVGIFVTAYTMKIHFSGPGFTLMPSCMQAFGIGGLYAYGRKTKIEPYVKHILNVLFIIASSVFIYWRLQEDRGATMSYLYLTINSVIAVWLIHRVIENRSVRIQKYVLENYFFNKIGKVSYGIYLFHYPMPYIYEKFVHKYFDYETSLGVFLYDWKNAWFIRVFLLLALSLASFYWFEKPIMNLKIFFEYKKEVAEVS
jgi:peptidoglycan/LPS O-acetylase OafA/YrhL